jgi:hypothetical protein
MSKKLSTFPHNNFDIRTRTQLLQAQLCCVRESTLVENNQFAMQHRLHAQNLHIARLEEKILCVSKIEETSDSTKDTPIEIDLFNNAK